jgi:signal transduction histidine kinase
MDTDDLVNRFARHRTLQEAPRRELEWLAAHGHTERIELGEFVTRRHDLTDKMGVVLSGHIVIHVDRGLGPRKVMEWGAGDITGLLPYSRMGKSPGEMVADEAGDVFVVDRHEFPEMIRECPTITATLVHLMLDRARRFTTSDLQDEKMMTLGRMSAGLAHELNNPASAATRSAKLLIAELSELEDASRLLGAAGITAAQLAAIDSWRERCLSAPPTAPSPVERADREEAFAEWLEAHGADAHAAAALTGTALTLVNLDALAAILDGGTLATALRWITADCTTRMLATELETAARRIHELVAAMKRVTFMDRASAPEAIDLSSGLNDSLLLLLHKARRKSVAVAVNLPPDLPRVRAIGGDLNQIWMNLIDNAIDAAPESGRIAITAARKPGAVVVSVVDDGAGIPPELQERIFEPLFTTKPVGQGTGLGLDTARRLARRNNGDIELKSRPGRTEFRVALPVAEG